MLDMATKTKGKDGYATTLLGPLGGAPSGCGGRSGTRREPVEAVPISVHKQIGWRWCTPSQHLMHRTGESKAGDEEVADDSDVADEADEQSEMGGEAGEAGERGGSGENPVSGFLRKSTSRSHLERRRSMPETMERRHHSLRREVSRWSKSAWRSRSGVPQQAKSEDWKEWRATNKGTLRFDIHREEDNKVMPPRLTPTRASVDSEVQVGAVFGASARFQAESGKTTKKKKLGYICKRHTYLNRRSRIENAGILMGPEPGKRSQRVKTVKKSGLRKSTGKAARGANKVPKLITTVVADRWEAHWRTSGLTAPGEINELSLLDRRVTPENATVRYDTMIRTKFSKIQVTFDPDPDKIERRRRQLKFSVRTRKFQAQRLGYSVRTSSDWDQ
ncbi:hypothetical protein GGX14DRAFT_671898 [Mycena pura]|uniref:Uncharacterized protein n=1 Tax=Mycena pura TaxID=153505 RepID=A0AAD6UX66_9AGAR|nr:hypothetical protein GGX14DRAFT_671898 [Mycena pura]